MDLVDVHSASILIVDDHQSKVDLLEGILLEDSYTNLLSTADPELIFELHREHSFDLILLDLELSVTDGLEVMQALKNYFSDDYLPVIVLTSDSKKKSTALHRGAKDFISIPFDKLDVLTRIRNILEARLLHKELQKSVEELEFQVQERTAKLEESEARFKGLTELSSDWHWEQDSEGGFTNISGPVPEILGIDIDSTENDTSTLSSTGWNPQEQLALREKIEARESFLDFEFTRSNSDGSEQTFLVSGQPIFDRSCNFLGYRGIGVDISAMKKK